MQFIQMENHVVQYSMYYRTIITGIQMKRSSLMRRLMNMKSGAYQSDGGRANDEGWIRSSHKHHFLFESLQQIRQPVHSIQLFIDNIIIFSGEFNCCCFFPTRKMLVA